MVRFAPPLYATFLLAVALCPRPSALASPSIQDGFNDGAASGTLKGTTGGTGWTGGWTSTDYPSGTATPATATTDAASYNATGLTFGPNFTTSGGTASPAVSSATNAGGQELSTRQFGTTLTGTVYGAFLLQAVTETGGHAVSGLAFGPQNAIDGSGGNTFYVGASNYNNINLGQAVIGTTAVAATGTAITLGTTYVALFELDNVGATSGTQTVTEWILNQTQYNNFYGTNGTGLTAAALNGAATGTAATNVQQRATVTATPTTYGTIAPGQFANFYTYGYTNGGVATAATDYDELRLSTVSLADLAAVPEPSSLALLAAGAALGLTWLGKTVLRAGSVLD